MLKGVNSMIEKPMDVLEQFPIRKSKQQKQAFRDAIDAYVKTLGYTATIEKKSNAHNIVIGDSSNAKYLITAHYDTPASMPFPNFITPCNLPMYLLYQFLVVGALLLVSCGTAVLVGAVTGIYEAGLLTWYIIYFGFLFLMMFGPANKNNANDNTSGIVTLLEIAGALPEEQRNNVCFVLFDLEEAGLVGSAAYRKMHKAETEQQVVLNLDCVGDGNEIVMFPNKKLKKDTEKMNALAAVCCELDNKKLSLHTQGFSVCPSDHKNFPLGVGIMAFNRKKTIGLYCDKIHTNKDTVLDENNVIFLRDTLIRLISAAVQV